MIQTTILSIAGMSCGSCVRHVRRALDGMTGVVHVSVDLPGNLATVDHLPDRVDAASLVAAIRDAGYEATVHSTETRRDGADDSETPRSADCSTGCCCATQRSVHTGWDFGTSMIA
jgi:copper chaperone CopZ